MCSIEDNGRMNPSGNYDASSGGVILMSDYLTTYALVSLGITLNFIDIWLQLFKNNFL